MACMQLWLCILMLLHTGSSDPINEALQAQGLLGAHFGIPGLPATFDYIVVGGGTAGLTIANRLAANASATVAVIEAGGFYEFDNGNLSEIPADAGYFVGSAPLEKNTLVDWEQYTEAQEVSLNVAPVLFSARSHAHCVRTGSRRTNGLIHAG